MSAPRIGLALGSGGARGWCHIGVLRELEALGIVPDLVAGTSVGALVGAAWASDRLEALEDWLAGLTRARYLRLLDPHPFSGGLVEARGIEKMLDEIGVPERIEDFPRPFAAVATDMETGREIWLRDGPAHRAVRASAGIPGVMSPVFHRGTWLLDGAVVNPVPVSVTRAMGAEVIIAVDPSGNPSGTEWQPDPQQAHPHERASGLVQELVSLLHGGGAVSAGGAKAPATAPVAEPPHPSYFDVVMSAVSIMGDFIRRSRLAGEPPHVLLDARLHELSVLDLHHSDAAVAEGRRIVTQSADQIRAACAARA